MTKLAAVLLPVIMWLISPVFSFPDGAPISSCGFLFPKHNHLQQQTSSSPFVINVSSTSYSKGETIQVNLTSITPLMKFIGFVIKARRVEGNTDDIVGQFVDVDDEKIVGLSWYPATDGAVNCLTQANNTPRALVTLNWRSDADVGDVIFSAAFVQNFSHFWTGVNSDVVHGNESAADSQKYSAQAEILSHPSTEIREVSVGCGSSKGCFLYPRFCGSVKCTSAVSYQVMGDDRVKFEMFAKSNGYISLGLSKDTLMGDDLTLTCFMSNGVGKIQFGYNPKHYNVKHSAAEISDVQISSEDGFIYCSFVTPKTMTLTHYDRKHNADGSHVEPPEFTKVTKQMNLDEENYLLLAVGDVYQGTSDVPMKHIVLPVVSTKPVRVAAVNGSETVYGTGLSLYVKSHAILGLISWFFLAICGMIIARHFRWEMPRVCCGSAVWFQMHRCVMILVLLCSVAVIVLIFYGTGKFTTSAVAHAVCGLVTIGLCLLQVFVAFVRPDQKHKKRPVFTRFHKFGAFLIYVMAGATLILAPLSPILHPGLRFHLMWIIVTGFVMYAVWEVSFEIMRYCICTFEEPDTEKMHQDRIQAVKVVWFATFILFSLVLTILAAVYIGIA
ncbi:hypothetical protein CAPTEDRAFT_223351 [Capitella teleta]|uniref:Ferric-chelate reductase 1 n=1 Tax=Capitella teleta TaxID=283909 RepID=R7TUD2_CAPTE|nr:hypothetical protein CAPTEDRAFT_223351 [Capitella teleta]|eukprot:ELT97279.1 hypothetical protein CAPTEDRAFT_223351 [Capitella teleta]